MDLESLSKGLSLVSAAIATIKNLKDLLPPSSEKDDAQRGLEDAERNLRIAEAEIAKAFNYDLCQRHFPPGIMLSIDEFRSRCQICGNIVDYDA